MADADLRRPGAVNQPLRHDSAVEHVAGHARYVDDMPEHTVRGAHDRPHLVVVPTLEGLPSALLARHSHIVHEETDQTVEIPLVQAERIFRS